MSKPDDIPQWAWDKARATIASQNTGESLSETVARALIAERERAAQIVELYENPIGTDDKVGISKILFESFNNVRIQLVKLMASRIRKDDSQ